MNLIFPGLDLLRRYCNGQASHLIKHGSGCREVIVRNLRWTRGYPARLSRMEQGYFLGHFWL